MIKAILGLSNVAVLVVGLLGGTALTGAVGAGGFWLWQTFVEGPHIADLIKAAEAQQLASDTIKIQQAADEAKAEEAAYQQKVAAEAMAAYKAQVDAQLEQDNIMQNQLAQENADYEKKLSAEGRSCPLTSDDISELRK